MRILLSITLLALVGCTRVYQLPDPPPVDEQGEVTLDPAEERRLSGERFSDARRSVLALYEAFGASAWDDALELLSNETQILLAAGGDGDGAAALASGRVTVGGETFGFDPVDLFLIAEPQSFEDDWEGEEQHETGRRKEIFIVAGDAVRKVVVIMEAGAWRVHMRRWPVERLERVGG